MTSTKISTINQKLSTSIKLKSSLIKRAKLTSSRAAAAPAPSKHHNYTFQRFNYLNKLLIILIVILINCIVGNYCAWQENVRPKLYVELGEYPVIHHCLFFSNHISFHFHFTYKLFN
jgi:hypothetical protein